MLQVTFAVDDKESSSSCREELSDTVPCNGENWDCSGDRSPLMKPSDFCRCHDINSTNIDSAKHVLKDLNRNALSASLGPGYLRNSVWNDIPPKQVLEIKTKFE